MDIGGPRSLTHNIPDLLAETISSKGATTAHATINQLKNLS